MFKLQKCKISEEILKSMLKSMSINSEDHFRENVTIEGFARVGIF